MNPATHFPPILAGRLFDGDPSEVGRYALERGSGLRVEDALVIFGTLLTLLSVISLLGWLRQQRVRPHRLVVFNRVGRDLGLTLTDRWLLWRIARDAGLPTPLALLLTPGTLGRHARDHLRRPRKNHGLNRPRRVHALARAASIRRHVFGRPPKLRP
ncbi:MAG: hypothetical protein AAF800_12265 [Planctomycetota bacterium]